MVDGDLDVMEYETSYDPDNLLLDVSRIWLKKNEIDKKKMLSVHMELDKITWYINRYSKDNHYKIKCGKINFNKK